VDTVTHNALPYYRNDMINTNIKSFVEADGVEAKVFNRGGWSGVIVIDRQNKVTVTVSTKLTLERIPRKKNRKWPHYLQTILHILNSDFEAPVKQMSLHELYGDDITIFTEEEYRDDFDSILNDEISYDDGYRHGVVVYTRDRQSISDIEFRILDPDFDTVSAYSLMDMLKPDFADLTAEEMDDEYADKTPSLVSLKAGLKKASSNDGASLPLAHLKTEEEEGKQA
jgi:hypothetical protein